MIDETNEVIAYGLKPEHKIKYCRIVAIVGDTKAELKQFCNEIVPKQKEKRRLQRKQDRQRRANNPQNYNENGTVKKGNKKWKRSNRYKQTSSEIAELERKLAAHRKSLHGRDINKIIAIGTSKILNAQILLGCDEGEFQTERSTNEVIARVLGTSMKKIDRVKKRFVMESIDAALTKKKGAASTKEKLIEILKPTWLH